MTGIELLADATRLRPDMPVVLMTAFATVSTAVEAMKLGAYDYIQKPFDGDEIRILVDRTLEHARLIRENQALRTMTEMNAPRPLIGGSRVDGGSKEANRTGRAELGDGFDSRRKRYGQGEGARVEFMPPRPGAERPMLAVNCALFQKIRWEL